MSKLASRIAQFLAPVALLALAAGCPSREVGAVDPNQTKEQGKEIPVQINRDIDILFVIDNSGSMREEQESLATNFNRFINVLQSIEGGLPNVHIGVISTDIGAGSAGGCEGPGDQGELIQSVGGCQGPSDPYIVDIADENGNRTTNYQGDLADTFSCMARLGTEGCGFEQQLEAMRMALDNNPANQGFLRDDAFLAVIFITDEDDCSTMDPTMFGNPGADLDSELGPQDSFRCFEFGVRCDPDNPREVGPRQNCEPRDNSPYMYDVGRYIDFLKGLKSDPNKVIVAGIIGDPTPVGVSIVEKNMRDVAVVDESCSSGAGVAYPGIRMNAFLSGFPNRTTTTTICNNDLSGALEKIGELLATVIGNPCIEGNLADGDPDTPDIQPVCNVTDVLNKGSENQSETVIPDCSVSNTIPCFKFLESAECSTTPTGLALQICRGHEDDDPSCPDGAPQDVPVGTTAVIRCVAE